MLKLVAQDLFAGSCGGASGILAGYPFDTVKVLIQNQTLPVRYTSTFQTIALVIKEDGFLRLYRGLATPMITVAFYNAITFSVYEAALKKIQENKQPSTHGAHQHAFAGGISGLVRTLFISPIEVVKVQMQIPRETKISAVECMKLIYKEAGLLGFGRGYLMCFAREPLAFMCYFGSFEAMTRDRKSNHLTVLVAGGIAGIISWMPTYPFDTIKTRMQGDGFGKEQKFKNVLHCYKYTISGQGPSILYRGFGSCIYRAFVVNAGVLFVYTQVKNFFNQMNTMNK